MESSVLGPARIYSARNEVDREFWVLFCALVDFQVPVMSVLKPMLMGLIEFMEKERLRFIELIHDDESARRVLSEFSWVSGGGTRNIGFKHRFVKIDDIISLFRVFRKIIEEKGSLGSFVKEVYEKSLSREEPVEGVVFGLVKLLSGYGGRPPLVPVECTSALKRLNLFMRWMVRPYPDLNLWNFIDKRHLLVSLDDGLRRVLSRAFSVNVRPNWRGVIDATRFLRKLNPDDPVKYDYLLSRVSIMGYCAKELEKSRCYLCPLVNLCEASRFKPEPHHVPLKGKEREIFEKFLSVYGEEFDSVTTEYPLEGYRADAVLHRRSCETWIVEVEEKLNYNAIGQVVTYRYLFFKTRGVKAKPVIVCLRSDKRLREACEVEQGVEVVEVGVEQHGFRIV
ncbi:MAG: DUF2400 family protein [Candidatus Jordarchaeales archaeon]